MVVVCFVFIKHIQKSWEHLSVGKRSVYQKVLKRKVGVLIEHSLVVLHVTASSSPIDWSAPLKVPDMKHVKIMGPKPINIK